MQSLLHVYCRLNGSKTTNGQEILLLPILRPARLFSTTVGKTCISRPFLRSSRSLVKQTEVSSTTAVSPFTCLTRFAHTTHQGANMASVWASDLETRLRYSTCCTVCRSSVIAEKVKYMWSCERVTPWHGEACSSSLSIPRTTSTYSAKVPRRAFEVATAYRQLLLLLGCRRAWPMIPKHVGTKRMTRDDYGWSSVWVLPPMAVVTHLEVLVLQSTRGDSRLRW